MTCPYLDYRTGAEGKAFETPRAYCSAAERFVQSMRADLCNDRYDLSHAEHCEIYLDHEAEREDERENEGEDGDRAGDGR